MTLTDSSWLILAMSYATKDDEPLTFSQLGLPTALIINRMRILLALQALVNLHEQQEHEPDHQPDAGEQRENEAAEEVDQLSAGITIGLE